MKTQKARNFFGIAFPFFVVFFLYLDSGTFTIRYFEGRLLVNILTVISFLLMLIVADKELKKLMLGMFFLAILGEQIFCNLLDMYDYRGNQIPFYVPFGHAIVLGSAFMLSKNLSAIKHEKILKKVFPVFFGTIFAVAVLFFQDYLTLILSVLFFHSLIRKKWSLFFCFLTLYVLAIEYAGTYFEIWVWDLKSFGYIPTLNPPPGIVYCYIGSTSLLMRIIRFIEKKKLRSKELKT